MKSDAYSECPVCGMPLVEVDALPGESLPSAEVVVWNRDGEPLGTILCAWGHEWEVLVAWRTPGHNLYELVP